MWGAIGHWLSVDPLSDRYPGISPYAYAAWNPIKYVDPDGREKHVFHNKIESYAAKNFKDDNGIYFFAHGSIKGYIKNDSGGEMLPERVKAGDIANYIVNNSKQWMDDETNGNASMVFLYACYAGEGDNSLAQQLSEQLNSHETYVIGPMDVLTSSSTSGDVNQKYDKIENGRPWGVYKDGKLITTINGKRKPTKATVECKLFFDNLLKLIKNFLKHENE